MCAQKVTSYKIKNHVSANIAYVLLLVPGFCKYGIQRECKTVFMLFGYDHFNHTELFESLQELSKQQKKDLVCIQKSSLYFKAPEINEEFLRVMRLSCIRALYNKGTDVVAEGSSILSG